MGRLPASDRVRVVPIDALPELTFLLAAIVAFAVDALRAGCRRMPDSAGHVHEPFAMRELRAVHELVAGEQPLPHTFPAHEAPNGWRQASCRVRVGEVQLSCTREGQSEGRVDLATC